MNRISSKPSAMLCVWGLVLSCGIAGCGNGGSGENTASLEDAVQDTWNVDMDATVAAILADENASQKDKDEAANMPDFARQMMAEMSFTITADELTINTGRNVETMSYVVLTQADDELIIAMEREGNKKDATLSLTGEGHLQLVTDEGKGDMDRLFWKRAEMP